jgi:hypothetical protein
MTPGTRAMRIDHFDDYNAEMRHCVVEPCETIIDTSDHEAQQCGRCTEYVCPEHQWTVDGDTWCTECASGHQGEAERRTKESKGHG